MVDDDLLGAGADYLERLYSDWRHDAAAVAPPWRRLFAGLGAADADAAEHARTLARMQEAFRRSICPPVTAGAGTFDIEYPSRAIYLIHAWRVHGHLQADLDPLRLNPPKPSPELELGYYGLSEADLDVEFPTGDLPGPARQPLSAIIATLERTYCGHIGPEFMHITDSARKHWLQQRLESVQSTPRFSDEVRMRIYSMVMRAEGFEQFLHTRYVGQKRFSLEGGESLIAMLDHLITHAAGCGVRELILGMAHRGRLNVLANILGKSLSEIFAEFEGVVTADAAHGAGDVKYHLGFSSDLETSRGRVHLSLAFNPSHLEIITPVVLGSVRARQCRRRDKERRQVMSVLVHGDAAFAGQGVVAESLNLSKLRGFRTGGTIHIVVNNQIGFTVNPFDARSTTYCTDIAKMVQAPILHVNGDDPEACCLAVEIAMDYRHRFREDIVIDLVCYRRHGHNESDAPDVTQPLMYRRIAEHPTTHELYRRRLIADGLLDEAGAKAMWQHYRERLERIRREKDRLPVPRHDTLSGRWSGFVSSGATEPETAVPEERLRALVRRAHQLPEGFALHPRVRRIFDQRLAMAEGRMPVDWGAAENMAYATLIDDGGWIRLTGQDSGRGTFFHRHAIVYDQKSGKGFIPLRQLERGELSHFIVVDSMLSELAVMAYEYGYSLAEPRALVIWEAQYGDFANNGQVVIDQFIAAGESKWERMSGLVLWLPHGYEGQGAEHSSARLERYLQLCAEENMQVVAPTTPAQLFHLLRRQFHINTRKPLVLMGPKSLLRNRASFSDLSAFSHGRFQPVIPEQDPAHDPAVCRRLLLCSGKVYYDLVAAREDASVGIVRLERLYPFPAEELRAILAGYPRAEQVVWVQEEPFNQGAWFEINSSIRQVLDPHQRLGCVARPALAAPAVGSAVRHKEEQETVVRRALYGDRE
ncbi:MAG: 2-oxoglutarate dehydrogenase E1 component [Zetaproteobacteria bacterium]|nr:MAG: 2-oxoglutarate dehydrogenase E1 component [Zetaproteobacteria bacterium]